MSSTTPPNFAEHQTTPVQQSRRFPKKTIIAAVVAGLVIAGAAASGSSHKTSAGTSTTASGCVFKATDSCTPHVVANKPVRVDALVWQVRDSVRSTVPDSSTGLVGVDLSVHSDRASQADLVGPQPNAPVSLKVGKFTYTPDEAANATGGVPLMGMTIQPDDTLKGSVEFDVPTALLRQPMELQFEELGFGSTKGYIQLPVKPVR